MLLGFLVEFLEVLEFVLVQTLDILVKFIKISVLLVDRINDSFVLRYVIVSTTLDCLLESLVLFLDHLLLLSLLLDQSLHLSNLLLKFVNLCLVLRSLTVHLLF